MALQQKVGSVAIIGSILPQVRDQEFLVPEREGGIRSPHRGYPPDIKDMTALLSRVEREAGWLFVLSYPSDPVLYTRQAKELGISAAFQWLAIRPTIPAYRKMFGSWPTALSAWATGRRRTRWPRAKPFCDAYLALQRGTDYLDTARP
jgi:branched-chain amino acid transport system substrate-binding protein